MVAKRLIIGLVSLHLMMGCTGGNEGCKAFVNARRRWACPPPWILWGDKCYRVIVEKLTWFGARDECVKMGGDLVAPQSQEETDFLLQLKATNFWINCNDLETEDTWNCLDGNIAVEYRNWSQNKKWPQPDNYGGNEHCAEVYGIGVWNDKSCNTPLHAICKSAIGHHYSCTF